MGEFFTMKKLLFVLGTRPEGIKMCPLILEARSRKDEFSVMVCNTGQHRELLDSVFELFQVKPDYNLNSMIPNQTLCYSLSTILSALRTIIREESTDYVVVQGDTTSTLAGALAGYYNKIPVVHLEAGLRSGDIYSPFPEEGNRKMVSQIADIHFCSTKYNADTLHREGTQSNVYVVGNTGLDALEHTLKIIPTKTVFDGNTVLLTLHRRESFDSGIYKIFDVINTLTVKHGVYVRFPVHPNPTLGKIVNEYLIPDSHLFIWPPLNYRDFVTAIQHSDLILTDSGGVQEEAPFIGVPTIVLREKTERMETVNSGSSFLLGYDTETIIRTSLELLSRKHRMDRDLSYGDGKSSGRICDILKST